jgi:hypothetical protein
MIVIGDIDDEMRSPNIPKMLKESDIDEAILSKFPFQCNPTGHLH